MNRKSFLRTIFFLIFSWFGLFTATAQSVGGTTSGAATYCSSSNSGFISLTGFTGSILNWESSINGGLSWTNIGNITATQSYFNLSVTTCYRAIVQSGAFPPDTSTVSCITVFQPSNGGTITGAGTFCSASGNGTLYLSAYTGTVLNWIVSTDGGATWSSIASTADSLNYLSITANTVYAAVVQNAACPVDTSAFANFIIVPPSVGGTVGPNDSVCYLSNNGAVTLSGNTGTIVTWISSTDGGLSWTNLSTGGSTFPYNALTQTTTYAAVVQNSSCPADTSASATITVLLPMPVSAGSDTTLQPGESVSLNGTGTGIPLWTPSTGLDSTSIFSPLASPTETTTYLLSVIDNNGCINSDAVTVTVISPVFNGIITTLFTPNGDGVNDYWYIQNIENFPDNEVIIYNIHGQKIYNKKGYMNDWQGTYNGQNLPDGTYYYILKFEKEEAVFKGSLDILSNK